MQKEIEWLLKEKYFGKETAGFLKDVKRLEAGEPVDFVIGFIEFLGCKIDLSKKPLIPRPETEFWVEQAIDEINNPTSPKGFAGQNLRILDIFSGSGCIGIAILKNLKNSTVDFADKDKNAILQIKINFVKNISLIRANKGKGVVVESDIFSNIKNKYDFIFANPPYIPIKNKSKIQKSVLKFEPKNALFGGADGLYYIRKFLKEAKNYLRAERNPTSPRLRGARIFMEFDSPQKKEIEKLIKENKYKNFEFHRDQFNRWRWVEIG